MSKGKPGMRGLVYFMRRADGVGPIKIGCSKWPEARVKQLQMWSPEPLEIVASVEGTFADEVRLHRQFAEYRLHAEWFEAAPPVLAAMARVASTGQLPPRPANDRNVQIMARYNSGDTLQEIATSFGVTRQRVEQIVRKEGGVRRGHRSVKRAPVWAKLDQLRSLAAAGCTKAEIADALGDAVPNIRNACRAEGIATKRARKKVSDRIAAEAFDIAAEYKAGVSTYEIASKRGRQQPEIYRLLRFAGVKPNRRARPVYCLPFGEIIAAYKAGATLNELAAQHDRAAPTIKAHLTKAGVVLRSRAENEAIRVERVRAANSRRAA